MSNTGRTSCTMAFLGRNMTANLNFVISNTKFHTDFWDEDLNRQLCSLTMMEYSPLRVNLCKKCSCPRIPDWTKP